MDGSLRTVGAVGAAAALVLLVLSPALLFGQSFGAAGLVLTGAGVLVAGLLLRWSGTAKTVGTAVTIAGGLILLVALGLLGLVLLGGRGY
jgi:hypothetical protein